MLTHFPAALPDELLYSRLARYHVHSGSLSPKQTLDDLFGDRLVRAAIDLQCHLHALSNRVSDLTRCAPHDLLRDTLFGYYASYHPADVVKAAENAMIHGPAAGLHARLGIAAGMRLPPHPLRWCPRCHAEALLLHGEGYWRRAHQLPGVLVCPSHGLPLLNAALPSDAGRHEFIAATFRSCPEQAQRLPDWASDPSPVQKLWSIALTDHCRNRLIAACLAGPSGRLRIDDLARRA